MLVLCPPPLASSPNQAKLIDNMAMNFNEIYTQITAGPEGRPFFPFLNYKLQALV